MEKKNIAGILAILAMVLVGISFGSGWYGIDERVTNDYGTDYTEMTMYLNKVKVTDGHHSEILYYDDYPAARNSNFVEVFYNIRNLLAISMIALIGVVGVAFLSSIKNLKAIIFVATIFLLVTPIYMAVSLPDAFARDDIWDGFSSSPATSFIGSYSDNGYDYWDGYYTDYAHWAPSIGYYLVIISFILMLASGIIIWKEK